MIIKRIIFKGLEIELEEPLDIPDDCEDKDTVIFAAFKAYNNKVKELRELLEKTLDILIEQISDNNDTLEQLRDILDEKLDD